MRKLRIAVPTRLFDAPLRQAIAGAARINAAGVQFDARTEVKPNELSETGRRQLLHYLAERDLKVAAMTFPLRHALAHPADLDARLAGIRQAMQFTRQLNADTLIIRLGRVPPTDSTAEYEMLVAVLSDLARHGNHIGVTLALTPSTASAATVSTLIEQVATGPVGIDFDPANCVLSDLNPADAFRAWHRWISHVTLRDAVRDIDGSGKEVPLGRGEVDWDEILALLDEADYAGWQTVTRTSGTQKVQDVARGIVYLGNVLQR